MENRLKPGGYMKVSSLNEFLESKNDFYDISDKVKGVEKHNGIEDYYYNTEDLKSVIPSDQFRLIECAVITSLILE